MMSSIVFSVAFESVPGTAVLPCSSSLLSSVLEYISQLPVESNDAIERFLSLDRSRGWRLSLTQSSILSLRKDSFADCLNPADQ
jgi:hypothetical protein